MVLISSGQSECIELNNGHRLVSEIAAVFYVNFVKFCI